MGHVTVDLQDFSLLDPASSHQVFVLADADQCKYGKNRVEADAKRLQAKEEELMKKKQEIRNHLTQLKKERRDLRTAVEAAVGRSNKSSLQKLCLTSPSLFKGHSQSSSHLLLQ